MATKLWLHIALIALKWVWSTILGKPLIAIMIDLGKSSRLWPFNQHVALCPNGHDTDFRVTECTDMLAGTRSTSAHASNNYCQIHLRSNFACSVCETVYVHRLQLTAMDYHGTNGNIQYCRFQFLSNFRVPVSVPHVRSTDRGACMQPTHRN